VGKVTTCPEPCITDLVIYPPICSMTQEKVISIGIGTASAVMVWPTQMSVGFVWVFARKDQFLVWFDFFLTLFSIL